jgi:tRNA (guanine37-N1)-methyltransferase
MSLRFEILTLFPGFFDGPLRYGVLKRALDQDLCSIALHDLRTWTHDRHRTVDDRPFGGGEGMVLKPEPLFEAVESLGIAPLAERDTARETVVLLSAQGKPFTQAIASELAQCERIVFICGRYEGVDERVNQALADREISVGDFVLSGGELGAALIVDAVTRLLPGVLGNEASSQHESFGATEARLKDERPATGVPSAVHGAGGLLDYPHYTRPAEFRGMAVPEVLAGGDHAAVKKWRRQQQLEKTFRNRPDLLAAAELSSDDRAYLQQLELQKSAKIV